MYETIFSTVLKSFALPFVFFLILKNTILGEENAFLAVTITLTIVTLLSLLFQVLSILPKLMLLKGHKLLKLMVKMGIEIVALLGFWYYYLTYYA